MIGFSVRAFLVTATHEYRDLTQYELQRTAFSLATTGVFGNPYAIPTGPTAHVSPGYPLILASVYRCFGAGPGGELAKELLASAVSALGWALLPWVGSAFGLPWIVGFAAGLTAALLPAKLSVETKGDWEAPYSALALIVITLVTAGIWRTRVFNIRAACRSGFAWGIGLLFVSALLPALFVFSIAGYVRNRSWQYIKFVAVQFAMAGVLLSPWIIRNWISLGSPVIARSNFGLEMRLSNNELAGPIERENFERGVYRVYHPLQSTVEAERVRQWGEVAYGRAALQDAVTWMRLHPRRFLTLTAQRIVFFWLQPIPEQPLRTLWLGALALLGFTGLRLLWRKQRLAAILLGIWMLVFPLPNYLVHVGLRHRYPLDWICALLSAYTIYEAARRLRYP